MVKEDTKPSSKKPNKPRRNKDTNSVGVSRDTVGIGGRNQAVDELLRVIESTPLAKAEVDSNYLMPTFRKTKHTLYVDDWNDDDYCYRANMYITMSQVLTDSPRGWNATPSSMTKLDARCLASMDAGADHTRIKDWVDAQRAAAVRLALGWADLLIQLGLQKISRNLLPAYTENDASEFWTEDSWTSFLLGLMSRRMKVPEWSINFAKCFLVFWCNSPPYGELGLPRSYYIPFAPRYTLSQAIAARDDLLAYQHGFLHLEKVGLPYKSFDPSMIEPIEVEYNSEVAEFHKLRATASYRNNSGATAVMYQHGNMCQNDTTEWTAVVIPMHKQGRPNNIYAMAPLYTRYEATYNPCAITSLSSALAVNNTFGFGQIAFMGTSFSAYISASDFVAKVLPSFWNGLLTSTFSAGGTTSALSSLLALRTLKNDVYYGNNISQGQWNQINEAAFQALWKSSIM